MASPKYDTLLKEMKRKLKEAKTSAEHIGRQDAEFERLCKLKKNELADELRALRKELSPHAISKMAKHQLINEIIQIKHALKEDVHVGYTEEEVHDAGHKGPARKTQKRANLSAKDAEDARVKDVGKRNMQDLFDSQNAKAAIKAKSTRKASPQLLRVAAKRKMGMSLKDAWAAVKAEDAK